MSHPPSTVSRPALPVSAHFVTGLSALSTAMGRVAAPPPEAPVARAVSALRDLNHSTEHDFLAVSGNLMEFLSGARQLHGAVEALSAVLAGPEVAETTAALEQVRTYAARVRAQASEEGESLTALRRESTRIRREFAGFSRIAASFRITAILARIETAHLAGQQEELGHLADEVRACSDGIEQRAGEIFAAAEEFDTRLARTLGAATKLNDAQSEDLATVLAAVDEDLGALGLRRQSAAEASQRLSRDLERLTNELGSIAVSTQFHDITRQQFEHIIEALEKTGGQPDRTGLIRLQSAQLRHSADTFTRSTAEIDGKLAAVAGEVEAMAAAAAALAGEEGSTEETSFLDRMSARLGDLTTGLSTSDTLGEGTRSVAAELAGICERLRRSVQEIQVIEAQLNRLAVNTAITSCHLGPVGDPLLVVAGEMQWLQGDCAQRSLVATEALASINGALTLLAGEGPAREQAGPSPIPAVAERIAALGAAGAECARALPEIREQAARLGASITASREHMTVGERVAETTARCLGWLAEAAPGAPEAAAAGLDSLTESELASRYTMHTERQVHAAALGLAPVAEAEPAEDDGIELF